MMRRVSLRVQSCDGKSQISHRFYPRRGSCSAHPGTLPLRPSRSSSEPRDLPHARLFSLALSFFSLRRITFSRSFVVHYTHIFHFPLVSTDADSFLPSIATYPKRSRAAYFSCRFHSSFCSFSSLCDTSVRSYYARCVVTIDPVSI